MIIPCLTVRQPWGGGEDCDLCPDCTADYAEAEPPARSDAE